MQKSNSLSIVIVNYNTHDLVVNCIQSILAETNLVELEIIVVDNKSADRRIETITQLNEQIRLIQSDENLGFGKANNLGMSHATGNYLLLLNSDTIIIEQVVDKAMDWLMNNNQFAVLGINQINEGEESIVDAESYTKLFSIMEYFLDLPLFTLFGRGNSKVEKLQRPIEVNQLSGAFMLLKKDVFENTKGFDPDFFMYYEETEWCQRIKKNYKIAYHPELNFIHLHGKSASREVMTKQMHLSAGLFWYKRGFFQFVMYLLISYLIYMPTWILLALTSRARRIHFKKYIIIYAALLKYFIFDIPRFSRKYKGRDEVLKLKELK